MRGRYNTAARPQWYPFAEDLARPLRARDDGRFVQLQELEVRRRPTGAKLPTGWDRSRIRDSGDVVAAFRAFTDARDQESFMAIFLDGRNRVVGFSEIARGGTSSVDVDPKVLLRRALAANASAIIVAHNHPSEDPAPSSEDREITRRLSEAGNTVGVPIMDHVVIGRDAYFSFQAGQK